MDREQASRGWGVGSLRTSYLWQVGEGQLGQESCAGVCRSIRGDRVAPEGASVLTHAKGGDLSSGCPGHSAVDPVGTEAGGLSGGLMAFVTRWQGDLSTLLPIMGDRSVHCAPVPPREDRGTTDTLVLTRRLQYDGQIKKNEVALQRERKHDVSGFRVRNESG